MAEAAESSGVALLLYRDEAALDQVVSSDVEGSVQALAKYATLVRDVLVELCGLKEFSHVEFLEVTSSYKSGESSSPLAAVLGTPLKGEEGELIGLADTKHVLDLAGALTASSALPSVFNDRLALDEEGVLSIVDEPLAKVVQRMNQRLKLDSRFTETLDEDEEDALAEGLGVRMQEVQEEAAASAPEGQEEPPQLSPVHPEDLLSLLSAFLHQAAGAPPSNRGKRGARGAGDGGGGGPNLLHLLGHAARAPQALLRLVGRNARLVQQNLWRAEELAVGTGKVALRLARKVVRPLVVGYVLHRVLTTLEDSRDLDVRLSKMSPKQALHTYYQDMLGDDYSKQMEADLLDAIKEVDEGLITEDYKDEKRLLTAAMLRRLEVEEWDKERMKHFYLGSYGLGPWYFDMEERLHNPYFIGARAWNGPIEGWVGKNKAYHGDVPIQSNVGASMIDAIEKSLGKRLTYSQRQRLLSREQASPIDLQTAPGGLLHGVVDRGTLEQHLAAGSSSGVAAAAAQ